MKTRIALLALMASALITLSCSNNEPQRKQKVHAPDTEQPKSVDPMSNKGIGPIKSVTLAAEVDQKLSEEGLVLFENTCSACHKIDSKYIGPALKGILNRRSPEWVMNMIMNPTEMLQKDAIAKQVLAESNGAIMADMSVTEDHARAILEYLRTQN